MRLCRGVLSWRISLHEAMRTEHDWWGDFHDFHYQQRKNWNLPIVSAVTNAAWRNEYSSKSINVDSHILLHILINGEIASISPIISEGDNWLQNIMRSISQRNITCKQHSVSSYKKTKFIIVIPQQIPNKISLLTLHHRVKSITSNCKRHRKIFL